MNSPRSGLLGAARHKLRVFGLYRKHRTEPEPFYRLIADEAVAAIDGRLGVKGRQVLDLGCGPGYYLDALERAEATAIGVEVSAVELLARELPVSTALLADGTCLPFPTATFDAVMCSNVLEHTDHRDELLREISRVLRPGGWAYVSWTPWYSPWGGHDMNPYQYLGPRFGPRVHRQIHGRPRKNAFGEALYYTTVGATIRLVKSIDEFEILRIEPRYWPTLAPIVKIPLVREIATGNGVFLLRRR